MQRVLKGFKEPLVAGWDLLAKILHYLFPFSINPATGWTLGVVSFLSMLAGTIALAAGWLWLTLSLWGSMGWISILVDAVTFSLALRLVIGSWIWYLEPFGEWLNKTFNINW